VLAESTKHHTSLPFGMPMMQRMTYECKNAHMEFQGVGDPGKMPTVVVRMSRKNRALQGAQSTAEFHTVVLTDPQSVKRLPVRAAPEAKLHGDRLSPTATPQAGGGRPFSPATPNQTRRTAAASALQEMGR
jgi:hypothetical protein